MISAQLSTVGGSNESEVALVFENPEGIAKEENAALGSGDIRSCGYLQSRSRQLDAKGLRIQCSGIGTVLQS